MVNIGNNKKSKVRKASSLFKKVNKSQRMVNLFAAPQASKNLSYNMFAGSNDFIGCCLLFIWFLFKILFSLI